MRVLLISSVEHQSGSALRFRGIAGALAARGHEVHLLEPASAASAPETPAGVRRHPCARLSVPPALQAPLWLLAGFLAVARVRPDAVYALKALPNSWLPARLAAWGGAKALVDLDDLDEAFYPPGPVRQLLAMLFRNAVRRADLVTVHNEAMRSRVDALREGRTPALFVDQGIDVERFARSVADGAPGLREELGLGDGPVLLYAGHLGPASDLEAILPALAPVAAQRPDVRLLVLGDGRARIRLEKAAARHLPAGFAVFAGGTSHREAPRYFALASVALNYLRDAEANRFRASIKVREALAAGVPVVTSRTVDTERFAEFVHFPDGATPEAFAEAVLLELDSPGRERARLGAEHLASKGTFAAAAAPLAKALEAWR
ncbi:MAG: glycosyltransferase [Gemmatimonadota bacterium]|nr:glycosyltransferase [Gemmatimonadota bacterium]